jgi:hypothetical protein
VVPESPAMIKTAQAQYPGIEFKVMAAEEMCLDEKFDLIILSNLIGYLDDIQQVLQEVRKVCHEHTKIIITYYNYLWEPLLKFAEKVGLKTPSPKQNWLTLHDINNLLSIPFFRFFSINFFTFAKPMLIPEEVVYSKKYSVSIVIPARNESGNIENAITRLPNFGKHQEIIFIEGNSTDDTWAKIQEIQKKYSATHDIKIGRQNAKGKADAVREGYAMATGDILMILDADLTVPPEDLPKFYDAMASGKGDFINGSRLVYPMEKEAMRFLNLLGNRFFSWAFTWLLEQRFKDTLCGTKVIFRSDYYKLVKNKKYFGDFDPFGDFDLIFGAHKLNLKIVEIPIRYRERTYGSTNISRFRHGLILLRMCLFASRKIKFI